MTEQKNSPVLRFPGFDSNWSKKRLKKIADINPKSKQNRPEQFNYIDLESVKQGRIINISKVSKDNAPSRAQRIAQKQDIFFQTVRPYQQNNFIYNFDVDDVVVSTGYAQFRTINHKYYIFTLLHTYRFLVNVLLNCTGSNYPAINSTDLSNIEVYITENKLEQEKIGNFFSKLDRQIELEEKKLELLEQQKRGYMQKIFSQELRFKDEIGNEYPEWKNTKLRNVIKLQNGYAFKSNLFTEKGIPIIRITDINKSLVSEGTVYYPRNINIDEKFIINKNDILIAMSGATTGKLGKYISDTSSYLNQRIGKFVMKNKTNNDFLFAYLNSIYFKKELIKLLVSGAQPNISSQDIENIELSLPDPEEQRKIGIFLSNFDEFIQKQSIKIEQLKQRKKGLLQKMFI